jgi:tRNA threonylcarbamoyladenosine biosynthesis protein TsaB
VLLAFDTATPLVTVALHDGQRVIAERVSDRPMKHGEQLAPLIDQVLIDGGASRHDLTRIVVGVGPGPFTGLRVGLVTARTLGFALGIPVTGVCSLDAIAAEAVAEGAIEGGFLVATDARRKEVYVASYDADGRRLTGPDVSRPDSVSSRTPVAGAGHDLYPECFPHAIGPHRPSAGWLAQVVVEGRAPLLEPEPLYLRRPDAVAGAPRKTVS